MSRAGRHGSTAGAAPQQDSPRLPARSFVKVKARISRVQPTAGGSDIGRDVPAVAAAVTRRPQGAPVTVTSALSSALWDLLNHTRLQPGVALELFDEWLSPVFEPTDDPRVVAARSAAGMEFRAGHEMSFRHVLQSGHDAQVLMPGWRLALHPVRLEQRPIGLLVAIADAGPEGQNEPAREVVEHGRAWRNVIEADVRAAQRLRTDDQRVQRSAALARFAADIQECQAEDQLLDAVLQALSVWYDVEARAYARDLSGRFVLRATLHGVDRSAVPRVLDAASLPAPRPTSGRRRVEHRGSHGRRDGWCFLVHGGVTEQWLITADKPLDGAVVPQIENLLHAFSVAIERVRQCEARALRGMVRDTICGAGNRRQPVTLATALLELICRRLGATEGDWTMTSASSDPPTRNPPASALTLPLSVGLNRTGDIRVRRDTTEPFLPGDVETLLAVAPLLAAWLAGGAGARDWTATFPGPARPGTTTPPRATHLSS